jgi:hypothetical protein
MVSRPTGLISAAIVVPAVGSVPNGAATDTTEAAHRPGDAVLAITCRQSLDVRKDPRHAPAGD